MLAHDLREKRPILIRTYLRQNISAYIATQQGRVKCRHHITIPAVPTQEAILEEGI